MRKNRRLVERFGIREDDRVKLRIRGSVLAEDTDGEGCKEIKGTVYQIYQDFVVIMTRYGTHPSFPWSDFLRWRTE